MVKSELTESVMLAVPGLLQRDAETAVNAILATITNAVAHGRRVELRGFGAFSVAKRRSRVGRNPRTGKPASVAPKRTLMFRASKQIREALKGLSQIQKSIRSEGAS